MKKLFLIMFLSIFIPKNVYAGSISWGSISQSDNYNYTITIKANDINANYLSGNINIKNGHITSIKTLNGWQNKTGNNSNFNFYHNGKSSGNYVIAEVFVRMDSYYNSSYSLSNIDYGVAKCQNRFGLWFDNNANIVSESSFNNSICVKSNDATLKDLRINNYSFNSSFSKNNKNYHAYVPESVNTVTFSATPSSDKAHITNGLTCNLTGKVTVCKISIQAENGNTLSYYVNVYKTSNSNNSSSNNTYDKDINNFKVYNGSLDKDFNINVNNYNIKPNKGADYIYFEFDTPYNHVSNKKCSTQSSSCSITIKVNNKTYTYNFNILSNEDNASVDNSSNQKITTTNTKKSTNTKNKVQTKINTNNKTNKPSSNNTGEIEKDENSEVKVEEKEEETTVNPVIHNKKKETKKEDKEETIENNKSENKKDNIKKNTTLVVLAAINLCLGILIGKYIKKS